MKKVLLFAAVAVSFTMISCKKDYTCSCTYNSGSSATLEMKKVKKKDAEDACGTQETNLKNAGYSDASCSI